MPPSGGRAGRHVLLAPHLPGPITTFQGEDCDIDICHAVASHCPGHTSVLSQGQAGATVTGVRLSVSSSAQRAIDLCAVVRPIAHHFSSRPPVISRLICKDNESNDLNVESFQPQTQIPSDG